MLDERRPDRSSLEAGGASTQHHKKPSASSISSSSSASTTSKTAAFFGSSHGDLAVRPAAPPPFPSSSSSTSLSRAGGVDEGPGQSGRWERDAEGEEEERSGMVQRGSSSGYSSASVTLAALQARNPSSQQLQLDGTQLDRRTSSSSALSGGRKSWIDFEGKPIVPLPSPGITTEYRQLGDAAMDLQYDSLVLDGHPPGTLSQQGGGLSIDTSMRRAPSTSNAAVAQHAARLMGNVGEHEDSAMMVDSPKTSNFFGSKVAGYWPRRSDHDVSPISPTPLRIGSDAASLHAPSRYPSITAHHPRPGLLAFDADSDFTPGRVSDQPPQILPLSVMGTQPLVPSAFISPPSPDPGADSAVGGASSFPTTRNGFSRHTHGPSENVTNSSILPHADLVNFAGKAENGFKAASGFSQGPIDEPIRRDSATGTPRPTASAAAVESEDEGAARVGSFVVERVLGTGAFSRVVLAKRVRGHANAVELAAAAQNSRERGGDGLVALKMLEKEPCRQNERMRVSWVREVEVLKHILHPNIVRFLTSFSTTKHHVLVLESVEGGELFEYLAQEQRSLARREWLVRRLFGELAGAVGWMHSINLVHRDVKLENVILTQHFRSLPALKSPDGLPDAPLVKLSDFGLSRFIDPSAPLLETRCGSEEYAAPELIIGKRYDGRQTDVWALGVVLYALLSGSLPFLSETPRTANGVAGGAAQGMASSRETVQQTGSVDQDAGARAARKAQLLRIAKGDLRWPEYTNDTSQDSPDPALCPPQHRLITPPARMLVARLLRRDATKRATAWEVWDEAWMRQGSFEGREASANGQSLRAPYDPRLPEGQAWLGHHARVHAGAPDVVHDD